MSRGSLVFPCVVVLGVFFASTLRADLLVRLSESDNINAAVVSRDGHNLYFADEKAVFKLSDSGCDRVSFDLLGGQDPETTVIEEASADAVWLGTSRGLYLLNGKDAVGPRFEGEIGELAISAIVHPGNESSVEPGGGFSDDLWVGTVDRGLFHVHNSHASPVCIENCDEEEVHALHLSDSGHIWAGINSGIYVIDAGTSEVTPKLIDGSKELIVAEFFEVDNTIWVTTKTGGPRAGGWRYAGGFRIDGGRIAPIFLKESLEIPVTVADVQGTPWIGTKTGLFRFDRNSGYPKRVWGITDTVSAIKETGGHEIWVGTPFQLHRATWRQVDNGPVFELIKSSIPEVQFAQSDLKLFGILHDNTDMREPAERVWAFGGSGIYRIDRGNQLIVSKLPRFVFRHQVEFDINYSKPIGSIVRCGPKEIFYKFAAIDDPNFNSWPERPAAELSPASEPLSTDTCCRSVVHVVARDNYSNVSPEVTGHVYTIFAYRRLYPFVAWTLVISALVWAAPYSRRARIIIGSERIAARIFFLNKVLLSFGPVSRRFLRSMIVRHSTSFFNSLPGSLCLRLAERKMLCLTLEGVKYDNTMTENLNWLGKDFLNSAVSLDFKGPSPGWRQVKRLRKAIPILVDVSQAELSGGPEGLVCQKIQGDTGWEEKVASVLLRRGTFLFALTNLDSLNEPSRAAIREFVAKVRKNHYLLVISEKPIKWIDCSDSISIDLRGRRWGHVALASGLSHADRLPAPQTDPEGRS